MSALLHPLKLILSHRGSVIATASLEILTAASGRERDRTGKAPCTASTDTDSSQMHLLGERAETIKSEEKGDLMNNSHFIQGNEPMFIETKYGIRLEITGKEHGLMHVSDTSQQALGNESLQTSDCTCCYESSKLTLLWSETVPIDLGKRKHPLHYYRLFPEWQTSYLWYDLSQDETIDANTDTHIDFNVIEERYPTLSPYFKAWRQVYETQFEKQECHLGSGEEVFLDSDSRITWEMEGFFIACWLAFRSDVHSVEYVPRSTKYKIEKGNIENVLSKFLRDVPRESGKISEA